MGVVLEAARRWRSAAHAYNRSEGEPEKAHELDDAEQELREIDKAYDTMMHALRQAGCIYGGEANEEPCNCPVCQAVARSVGFS